MKRTNPNPQDARGSGGRVSSGAGGGRTHGGVAGGRGRGTAGGGSSSGGGGGTKRPNFHDGDKYKDHGGKDHGGKGKCTATLPNGRTCGGGSNFHQPGCPVAQLANYNV